MALALVTGANRGLGLKTSELLLERGFDVLLTGRDLAATREAAASLKSERARAAALDVEDPASVAALAGELRSGPPIAALVNNAGASLSGFDAEVARRTLDINYRGAVRVTNALMPLLAETANIVMVSSGMGELSHLGEPLRRRLLAPELEFDAIEAMGAEFVELVRAGRHAERGYPSNAYSVSKALLNAFTRVLGRELEGTGRRVNAVCPGWVRTRMGGSGAPRSLEQGAKGIVWAATLDGGGPNGGFFRDGRQIEW